MNNEYFLPHIELTGNCEASVEGCKGVLQYNEEIVELNTGKISVRFTGCDLCLSSLDSNLAIVKGKIMTVEFL